MKEACVAKIKEPAVARFLWSWASGAAPKLSVTAGRRVERGFAAKKWFNNQFFINLPR
jgi:hypothetical protein